MKTAQNLTFLAFLVLPLTLIGQVPSTDIYLFDVVPSDGHYSVRNMVKVTDREGYDNQPFFHPDGKGLLFTSIRDTNQTDIYYYDFATKRTSQITRTHESEYSPMISPDGKLLTVVRVELDSTQRIWRMKPDGTKAKPLMESVKDVGYYCWLNKKTLAVWTVRDTTLSIVTIKDQVLKPVAKGAGRSFHLSPSGTKLVYLKLDHETDEHRMMLHNFVSGTTDTLIVTFAGEQDIAFHRDGELLMGHQGVIYSMLPGQDTEWHEWADLNNHGAGNFYRLALSADGKKLAVVAYHGSKP